MSILYTIYNGVIEQHELIKETPAAYRIEYIGYKSGRVIYKVTHSEHAFENTTYSTLDKNKAIECARQYTNRLNKQIEAINLSTAELAK